MLRGQKPKSNLVKFATGNPGKRPFNDQELIPEGEVIRPSNVKGRAAKVWDEFAPILIKTNYLSCLDVAEFGTWCILEAEWRRSPKQFTSALLTEKRRIGEKYGMGGQTSRARLRTNGKGNGDDPADEFYG